MNHFTLSQREMLEEFLLQKKSYRYIKSALGKSLSSISDEIQRNSVAGVYRAGKAHWLSRKRQKEKERRTKIEKSPGLRRYVIEKLQEDWSPEEISRVLKKKAGGNSVISHEAIYQYIYSDEGKQHGLWKHLRHKKKPQRMHWGTRKKRRKIIPNRRSIHQRPRFIHEREVFGHFEGDLMQFSSCKKTLAVFIERMSRKVCIVVNDDKSSSEMEMAMHECISTTGQQYFLSLTLDNGTENVIHESVREQYSYQFDTYFCDPYCSWQKGAVENMNKLIRQYFPRDLLPEKITQDFADEIAEKLNNRPRKCLNYETPLSIFLKCSV